MTGTASEPRLERTRRAFGIGAALAGLALLAACAPTGVGDAGQPLYGAQTRLPPLKSPPPAGQVTVQMLPFTGLPVTLADGIYQHFRIQAQKAGIVLVHRLEDPATWRVQGHFVALGNNTSSTILFTYDIYDAKGTRVQRIVGQEVSGQGDGDAWSGLTVDGQNRLAARAARAIAAWLNRAEG